MSNSFTLIIILIISIPISFQIGKFSQERQQNRSKYDLEKEVMEEIIADMDLKDVSISRYSGGGIYLMGTIPSEEKYEEMESRFLREIYHSERSMLRNTITIQQKNSSKTEQED